MNTGGKKMKVIVLELKNKEDEKWYEQVLKPILNARASDNITVDCSTPEKDIPNEDKEILRRITDILRELDIRPEIRGYEYIRETVKKSLENRDFLRVGVTKQVYPYLAKKFKTKPLRVERGIRHAIEASWQRGEQNKQTLQKFFGYSDSKNANRPTNSQFLAIVVDQLRLEK